MTTHLQQPSDVDADNLLQLIDDCQWLAVAAPPQPVGLRPAPRASGDQAVVINDRTAALVDGYSEYGG